VTVFEIDNVVSPGSISLLIFCNKEYVSFETLIFEYFVLSVIKHSLSFFLINLNLGLGHNRKKERKVAPGQDSTLNFYCSYMID
jgi:hypothetical protein